MTNEMQAMKQSRAAKANNKKKEMKDLRMEIRLTIIGVAITGIYACLCVTYFFWLRTLVSIP